MKFTSNRKERATVGATFEVDRLGGDRSESSTLVIASIRDFKGAHLVCFEGVEGRDAAERLRGAVLYAESLEDPEAVFVHELIGAEVVDVAGTRRGIVTSVEANPASDLLVIDDRAYVPMRFVVSSTKGRVVVDVPEGIFE